MILETEALPTTPASLVFATCCGLAGGLSIMSMFEDIVAWRGFFIELLELWSTVFTTAVSDNLSWTLHIWPFPWPAWAFDYYVVAVLFGLNFWLLAITGTPKTNDFDLDQLNETDTGSVGALRLRRTRVALAGAALFGLFWPLSAGLITPLLILTAPLRWPPTWRGIAYFYVLWSPFIFFLLAVAANFAFFLADLD